MLLENQYVDVKIAGRNINHYKTLGYNCNKGDIINVPVEHLTTGSHVKVDVRCDICGKTISKEYKQYLLQHTFDIDTCEKCRYIKVEKTCVDKYGVSAPLLSEEIQKKIKKTIKEKYNVDNISQSKEIKEKKIKTCFEHYGVEHPMQSNEVMEKSRKTCMEKYGVESYAQTEEKKEKTKETCLKKYGVEFPLQNKDIFKKIEKTNLNKYGYSCVLQVPEIKEKIKNTCLELYSVENPFSSDLIKEKIKNTNIERYGFPSPSMNESVLKKIKNTIHEKYGVEYVLQNPMILQKVYDTNISRYGVYNPMKCPKIREKAIRTLYEHGSIPTSKQQYNLYSKIKEIFPNAELNFPFGCYNLDIYVIINDVNIDLEYDGWYWHKNDIIDKKRDDYLIQNNFKVFRIKSGRKSPDFSVLLNKLYELAKNNYSYDEMILDDWKEGEVAV